jgi:hypothetical protein
MLSFKGRSGKAQTKCAGEELGNITKMSCVNLQTKTSIVSRIEAHPIVQVITKFWEEELKQSAYCRRSIS